MKVKILGSAAGGGFPQWNCGCRNCRLLREGRLRAAPRTQTQVAISSDGAQWFLLNASPDLRAQIEATPELHPRNGRRGSPIAGVLLTGADLDQVLGLLLLRELQPLHVGSGKSLPRFAAFEAMDGWRSRAGAVRKRRRTLADAAARHFSSPEMPLPPIRSVRSHHTAAYLSPSWPQSMLVRSGLPGRFRPVARAYAILRRGSLVSYKQLRDVRCPGENCRVSCHFQVPCCLRRTIWLRSRVCRPVSTVILAFACCAPPGAAQALKIVPTTTLRAETSNNTSAANGFRGQPNGNAPAGNVSKVLLRSLLYEGANTRVWVRYMPWFGDKGHVDIGYRSDDREQVRRQVEDMLNRGISGAIVDWYGPHQEHKNHSTQLLMREGEAHGFQFAISYDKGSLKDCTGGCDATGQMIRDLSYAYDEFERSSAYMRIDGRPAVFFFGLEKYPVQWDRLRSALPGRPLFFFRNSGAFRNADDDGGYSWVAPEAVKPGDPKSLEYLERFYRTSRENPKRFVIGSAYKGFNDSIAGWGHRPPRVIDQDCGDTWLETFAMAGRFFSRREQLPDLLVVTWNDYEEGTEIESGIDNCVSISAEISGRKLKWDLKGNDRTLDHFTVFVSIDGEHLMPLRDLPAKARSFDTDDVDLAPGNYVLFVKAVGRASFTNHMSQAVRYRAEGTHPD